jgi:hypothetical protein
MTTVEIGSPDLVLNLRVGEFWLLLQQFSPTVVLGLANPYQGWLVEEITAAERKALKSLMDRDLARKVSKDQIDLDDVLAQMIAACAQPRHSLIVQPQDVKRKTGQLFIHFVKDLIVEQCEFEPGQFRLTAIKDQDALVRRLDERLRLSTKTAGHGAKFRLSEEALMEVRSLCADGHAQKALAKLDKAKVPDARAAALVAALTAPVGNTAVALLSNRDRPELQHVKGFAFLESENELWIMLPLEKNEEKMIEFVPANGKQLKERFLQMLP